MNRTEQSRNTYNSRAQNYTETPEGRFTAQFKQELVRAVQLKPGAVVLDVACGNGDLLEMLAEKANITGYGIDLAENMIAEAQKLYPHFQFTAGGCERLLFEDAFVDVLTVSAAFHHFEKPGLFLKEAGRVLKPGGRLYIAELFWPGPLRILGNPLLPLLKSGDVKIYSPRQLEKLLCANGFTNVQSARHKHIQIVKGSVA